MAQVQTDDILRGFAFRVQAPTDPPFAMDGDDFLTGQQVKTHVDRPSIPCDVRARFVVQRRWSVKLSNFCDFAGSKLRTSDFRCRPLCSFRTFDRVGRPTNRLLRALLVALQTSHGRNVSYGSREMDVFKRSDAFNLSPKPTAVLYDTDESRSHRAKRIDRVKLAFFFLLPRLSSTTTISKKKYTTKTNTTHSTTRLSETIRQVTF